MLTFEKAESMMKSARLGKRKLANNTYLEKWNGDTFVVRLHNTYVVKIHRNGHYTLNSGNWHTNTTKNRINRYSSARIFQRDFAWYLGGEEFKDGTIVDKAGAIMQTCSQCKELHKLNDGICDECATYNRQAYEEYQLA